MDSTNLFDIQTSWETDIQLPPHKEGTLFILGDQQELPQVSHTINEYVLAGMDRSTSFHEYRTEVLYSPDAGAGALDYNIICPIFNPLSGREEYITAQSDVDALPLAVSEVVREAEAALRGWFKEAVVIDAVSDPEGFVSTMTEVLSALGSDDGGRGHVMSGGILHAARPGGNMSAALEGSSSDRRRLRNLSAQERKALFTKIPDKLNESFKRQSPEAAMMVNELMENFTPEETKAFIQRFFEKYKHAAQEALYTMIGGESNYELVIKPREYATMSIYKDKAQYLLYLKDAKGKEIPVVFKNAPSFCIYVMHVIDRYRKKGNTRVLDLRQLKNGFCLIYTAIFDESKDKILHVYDELESRISGQGDSAKKRRGRYPEYIKDIQTTFKEILGVENSMPFKVDNNNFLSLNPSNIHIPEDLAGLDLHNPPSLKEIFGEEEKEDKKVSLT